MQALIDLHAVFLFVILGTTGCVAVKEKETLTQSILIEEMISQVDSMPLSLIPEGEFLMGSDIRFASEGPSHKVYLPAYWMDQFEVTNGMYQKCVDKGACQLPVSTRYYDDPTYTSHPVVYVTWFMAQQYCIWAGRRLPSEAEWEKAARGTDGRDYPWGDFDPNEYRLNFASNIGGTTKVGSFPHGVSPYGLFDMAGNVFEWTNDWFDLEYYQNSPYLAPTGPDSGQFRVLRGGAWDYGGMEASVSFRIWYPPEDVYGEFGFRCASSVDS